jgi:hypothetical protein
LFLQRSRDATVEIIRDQFASRRSVLISYVVESQDYVLYIHLEEEQGIAATSILPTAIIKQVGGRVVSLLVGNYPGQSNISALWVKDGLSFGLDLTWISHLTFAPTRGGVMRIRLGLKWFTFAGWMMAVLMIPVASNTSTHPASASAAQDFIISIPGRSLDSPIRLPERPGVKTMADAIGSLTILADGKPCLKIDLTSSQARTASRAIEAHLGAAGQPSSCSPNGARITFRDAAGHELYEQATSTPGGVKTLTNFAPRPPHTGTQPLPWFSPIRSAMMTRDYQPTDGYVIGIGSDNGGSGGRIEQQGTILNQYDAAATWNAWTNTQKLDANGWCQGTVPCVVFANDGTCLAFTNCRLVPDITRSDVWATTYVMAGDYANLPAALVRTRSPCSWSHSTTNYSTRVPRCSTFNDTKLAMHSDSGTPVILVMGVAAETTILRAGSTKYGIR